MLRIKKLLCFAVVIITGSISVAQEQVSNIQSTNVYMKAYESFADLKFSDVNQKTKDYIIWYLSVAISSGNQLMIVGETEPVMEFSLQDYFGFEEFRLLKSFTKKYDNLTERRELVYVYREEKWVKPFVICEDPQIKNEIARYWPYPRKKALRFIIAKQCGEIYKQYVGKRPVYSEKRRIAINNDYTLMSITNFMDKYGISNIVTDSLYQTCQACLFLVYPHTDVDKHLEGVADIERLKRRLKDFYPKYMINTITLSPYELSEIVYLHHRINSPNNTNAYNETLSRSPEYLLPVTNIQTELGIMLKNELIKRGTLKQ